MSYSDGKIIAPVSVADVMSVVPVSLQRTNTQTQQTERGASCDVGTLCSAEVGQTITARDGKGNWTVVSRIPINMWARYKPINFAKIGSLTTQEWNNALHGVYHSTSLPLLNNSGRLNHDVWTYRKPTGGASSPYV